jgi:predicted deacylase
MQKTIETIDGDTPGVTYNFAVYRFDGGADAPSAYIQAALHGDELPGVVAIDALMPKLRRAEAEARIRGRITVVPSANPIGRSQYLFGDQQGRFHLGSRTNFNRDFPLLASPEDPIDSTSVELGPDARLKRRLLQLSMGHDIVLDLHCDDEGVPYLYVPKVLWPAMADVAAAMEMQAVVFWDGSSGSSFDEASVHPYLHVSPAERGHRVVTTVEYRGIRDVDAELAEADAEGLYRVLAIRGVIDDPSVTVGAFEGVAAPIEHVEMVKTPVAGAALFHVQPGDRVRANDLLATIVASPGEPDGRLEIRAPQAGYVFTRRAPKALVAGDDVLKLIGDAPSATHKDGALES